jgi:hypothetical protein
VYSDEEEVPVSELDSRFDPTDIRFDSYMRTAPSLFSALADGQVMDVYYLDRAVGRAELRRRLRRGLGAAGVDYEIVGSRSDFMIVPLVIATVSAFAVGASLGDKRWEAFLLFVSSVSPVLFFGWHALPTWFLWAVYVLAFMRPGKRASYLGLIILALLPVLASDPITPRTAVTWLGAGLGLLLSLRAVDVLRFGKRRDHSLFRPVPLRRPPRVPVPDSVSAPLVFLLCALTFSIPQYERRSDDLQVPSPVPVDEGSRIDLASLHRIGLNGSSALTGTAELVAHLAYQKGLAYGQDFDVPQPGEELILSEYRDREGLIVRVPRVVTTYDEDWLASSLDALVYPGVHTILLSEGTPVRVVNDQRPFVYSRGPRRPAVWGLVLLLFAGILAPRFIVNKRRALFA